jgi:FkbM family methyltransferase
MLKNLARQMARSDTARKVYRRLDLHFNLSGRLDWRNAAYDDQTAEIIRLVMHPDEVAIDVGAHSGLILREIMRYAPDSPHLAFEPIPAFADTIAAAYPSVRLFRACASDTRGTATFNHVENAPGYSGLRRRVYDRPDPVVTEMTVETVRIDDVVDPARRVCFIEIDVEGAELTVLRGAIETLRRDHPVVVFEAGEKSSGCYGVGPNDFYDLFESLGMRLNTQLRWLHGRPALDRAAYARSWMHDYNFVAAPEQLRTPHTVSPA